MNYIENSIQFDELRPVFPTKSQSVYLQIRWIIECLIILLLSPVILLIILITSVILIFDGKTNPFFVQDRIGLNGKPFKMYKQRSVGKNNEITKICQIMRNHRIDEVPQFLNILKGDMSIIGPRPEPLMWYHGIIEELPQFSYRNVIKPGLTCLSQIFVGYTHTSNDEERKELNKRKLVKDLEYIKGISPGMDLFILYKTISVVIKKTGAK